MLGDHCKVIVQTEWNGKDADILIALHARRSATSVASFQARQPGRAIALVLTGTDLYKDLPGSAEAVQSLEAAHRIVVLQEDAQRILEPRWRARSTVIVQSARFLKASRKPREPLGVVAVGHLRAEKDPRTLFAAMALIPAEIPVIVRHVGAALDESLGREARALARSDPRYRYLGGLPHGIARTLMKNAHFLVHPSVVEGGANVVIEAITSGTPVLASRISGNLGLLGRGYGGYFEPRDAAGLARLIVKAAGESAFRRDLQRQCAARRPLFSPAAEARALRQLVTELLQPAA
jgi:putative glycosyltransferase (TIGR04348 family)